MQTAHQAAASALSSASAPPTNAPSVASSNPPSREPSEFTASSPGVPDRIRTLWLRMTEIYGHRWTSAFGEDCEQGAGPTWAKGLTDVTSKQLAAGISAAIASADPWPPTLPEFRSLCLGIPSLAAVRHELRSRTGTRSPFVVQVWSFLDGYLFARASQEKADQMLRDAYLLAAEYVMRGGKLPKPATVAIEQSKPEKPVPASPETVQQHMAQIRDLLGESEPETEEGSDA